jgi:hypothetical protein
MKRKSKWMILNKIVMMNGKLIRIIISIYKNIKMMMSIDREGINNILKYNL